MLAILVLFCSFIIIADTNTIQCETVQTVFTALFSSLDFTDRSCYSGNSTFPADFLQNWTPSSGKPLLRLLPMFSQRTLLRFNKISSYAYLFSYSFFFLCRIQMSPWYNCNGWLGVKHQVTSLCCVQTSALKCPSNWFQICFDKLVTNLNEVVVGDKSLAVLPPLIMFL